MAGMQVEQHNMEVMATLVAMERLAQKGTAAVPHLLEYAASAQPVLASAAMRLLFGLLPTAALPTRWQKGTYWSFSANADVVRNGSGLNIELPAWISGNPYNTDAQQSLHRLCVEQIHCLPDTRSRSLFVKRLALFAGVRDELAAFFMAAGLTDEALKLQRAAAALEKQQYPGQVSFSPTMQCQLHCSYCIAGADKSESGEREASAGQVEALVTWMQQHGLSRLGLTGGEPSRYSRFPALLAQVRAAGLEYYMASNGLMDTAALDAILANPPLCLTLHLTPEVLHSNLLARFINTAQQVRQAGIYAILRCNFASPTDDALQHLQVAQDCNISELRIAIPMPNSQRGNNFVAMQQLAAFAPLLQTLVHRAKIEGMQIQLSKPYPMCFMPEEVGRHFLENGSLACVCPSYLLGFSNNLVVYPDLRFSACLGLNERSSIPITACAGPEDAAGLFADNISRRMHSPVMVQCCDCPLGQRGQCIGACLSYRSAALPAPLTAGGAP
ncbi:MAG: radical SAM protein [Desulfobulbaceae bacterium]|nr:radical SAM protein [Desulfobulbaceae bacterium]